MLPKFEVFEYGEIGYRTIVKVEQWHQKGFTSVNNQKAMTII